MNRQPAHLTDAGVLIALDRACRAWLADVNPTTAAAAIKARDFALLQMVRNGSSPADARELVAAAISLIAAECRTTQGA